LGTSKSLDYDLLGNYNNGEANDFWLAKIDKNLNLIWSKNFGGSYANGDLGGGNFVGNIVLCNNKLYCFLRVVVPDILPDYDITCGVSDGTFDFDAWIFVFDLPTSVADLPITNDIQVYPNPSKGSFTVESSLLKSACFVTLYAPDGKIVYKEKIAPANNKYIVNTQHLNAGFYYLVVTDGEQLMRSSIIIE